jgi:hypothetical protein
MCSHRNGLLAPASKEINKRACEHAAKQNIHHKVTKVDLFLLCDMHNKPQLKRRSSKFVQKKIRAIL